MNKLKWTASILFLIIILGYFYIPDNTFNFENKKPSVLVINIDGDIVTTNFFGIYEKRGQDREIGTSSMNVIRMLEFFSKEDSIKDFILEIDSGGGQTAGKEEIVRYIKRMDKPVIAVITGKALSSGYFVSAGTEKIYASESSQIGEIAKTFVYVDRHRNGQEQVCHITSSNYKTITSDECNGFDSLIFNKLKNLVGSSHELLVSHIAEMRKLPKSSIENLSDKFITSEEALKLKLIDEVGTTDDALAWLEQGLNLELSPIYLRDMVPNQT